MSYDALWYAGRGTGVVSLALLTVTVVLGIGNRSGRAVFGLPRFAVAVVHRNASLLAAGFLAVHVLSLLLDPYAKLRVYDLVLPFVGNYRPLWQGLGTVAFDLVLVLVATSLLRHRLGLRAWRAVHWTSYAAWPLAVAHGLGTGTDNTSQWVLWTVLVSVTAVLGALLWRLSDAFSETAQARSAPTPTSAVPAPPGPPPPGPRPAGPRVVIQPQNTGPQRTVPPRRPDPRAGRPQSRVDGRW